MQGLQFEHADPNDICAIGCADSSLQNVDGFKTQFGGSISLASQRDVDADKDVKLNLMYYWSRRQRRVVRSTLVAELLSLSTLLDRVVYALSVFRAMAKVQNVYVLTDRCSLVQSLLRRLEGGTLSLFSS